MGICKSICDSDDKKPKEPHADEQAQSRVQMQDIKIQMNSAHIKTQEPTYKFALKAPHGTAIRTIAEGQWIYGNNINAWIRSTYHYNSNSIAPHYQYTSWIVYNDDPPGTPASSSTHGHCKGILAWNNKTISWLIHSVPNFPSFFDGKQISEIAESELIYGQSFIFLENIDISRLQDILIQIKIMNPKIYNTNVDIDWNALDAQYPIREIQFTKTITHIAKARHWGQDLYEHLPRRFGGEWKCETWIRGHGCTDSHAVKDAHQIIWGSTSYKRTQDHSKYACSLNHVCIGDINRMTSQFHRGGGGVVVECAVMSKLFLEIMG